MHHMFFHPMLSQLFAGEFDAQGGSIPVHAVKAMHHIMVKIGRWEISPYRPVHYA